MEQKAPLPLNREQRRRLEREPKRSKPKAKFKKPRMRSPLALLGLVSRYTEEEQAKLSLETRKAWYNLCHGLGTETDYDILCYMINMAGVLTEHLPEAQQLVQEAGTALGAIRVRYHEKGVFGADAAALAVMPHMLEFHEELLAVCTPKQFIDAVQEVSRRQGEQP